ncbi:MAG: hypothetical protein Q9M91_08035 [Candidatus Dojkabacteria bacterium]|nr:hypothetical protein [Candidatus Dojkabacteria bacterium]MDQ7021733.1 hypothetical protein [Candidatus Dojkabacteria bacterium]
MLIFGVAFVALNSSTPNSESSDSGQITDIKPTSNPDDGNNQVEDPLDQFTTEDIKYAVITADKTIMTIDKNSKEIDINLERDDWKNLQFSNDGLYLSALKPYDFSYEDAEGETQTIEQYDLWIYSFKNESWEQVSNFNEVGRGIQSYEWSGDKNILFTQGEEENEIWLQSLDLEADNQILKEQIINADIIKITENGQYLVVKDTISYVIRVLTTKGNVAWDLGGIKSEGDINLVPTNLVFSKDSERVIFESKINPFISSMFKTYIGSDLAIDNFIENNFKTACSISNDDFIGYTLNNEVNELKFVYFNIAGNIIEQKIFASEIPLELDEETIECTSLGQYELLIKIDFDNDSKWYQYKDNSFLELDFALGAEEMIINPIYRN